MVSLRIQYYTKQSVKEDEMGRGCSKHIEKTNAYRVLVGEPEGQRPQERPRYIGR
jgi:hypothetical protein